MNCLRLVAQTRPVSKADFVERDIELRRGDARETDFKPDAAMWTAPPTAAAKRLNNARLRSDQASLSLSSR